MVITVCIGSLVSRRTERRRNNFVTIWSLPGYPAGIPSPSYQVTKKSIGIQNVKRIILIHSTDRFWKNRFMSKKIAMVKLLFGADIAVGNMTFHTVFIKTAYFYISRESAW